MKTFAVNDRNDLYFQKDGNLALVSGAEALAQIAAQYVRTLRGELIFDTQRGTPFNSTVWAASSRLPQFQAAIRQRLSSVEGVTAVASLDVTRQGETVTYTAALRTVFGDVSIDDTL